MAQRRKQWENLHADYLIQILNKVGRKSLLSSAQLVCKSWYQASLFTNCWKDLDFCVIHYGCPYDVTRVIKLAISFSKGTATRVVLPKTHIPSQALSCILDGCPNLNILGLPVVPFNFEKNNDFKTMFRRLKHLEALELGYCNPDNFSTMLSEICVHCKYWDSLSISPPTPNVERVILEEDARAIVELVPEKIKCLNLRCRITRESLVMIIRGCKRLIRLDVRDCVGFDAGDNEILKMASSIRNFMDEGSTADRRTKLETKNNKNSSMIKNFGFVLKQKI
ncbi:hypothetical protein ACHQM5_027619 [Ranunculus cassubicifolius]